MPIAKIIFNQLIQDSQEYGSNDEHMVSRVFFDVEFGGEVHRGLFANLKQPVGSSFETSPIEVSAPLNYKGPFNMQCFQRATEEYVRGFIGTQGSGIRVSGGSKVRMQNCTFRKQAIFECKI